MKFIKFPKGAYVDDAMCIIPISEDEKNIILLACHKVDVPYLYQPYVEDKPIVGESVIGTKEKTVNKYGTFFLTISQFEILDDILNNEMDYFYDLFYESGYEFSDLLKENEDLYKNYLERIASKN